MVKREIGTKAPMAPKAKALKCNMLIGLPLGTI